MVKTWVVGWDMQPSSVPQRDVGPRLEQALSALLRRGLSVRLADDATPVERTGYALLADLHDHGPQRLSDVACAVRLEKSTVSRQVAGLEERGLVERRPDLADRRAHLLALTEDGQRVVQTTRARRQQWLREALAGWSVHDRATLAQLLERLVDDLFPGDPPAPPRPARPLTPELEIQ
jgi:DNA-binding MarR family transcriptional regulator